MRALNKILSDIDFFIPEEGNWLDLENLLDELWNTGVPEKGLQYLFRIFERYPDEDGSGVFWSIVHGIENFSCYECELLDSLNQQPSEMGLTMVNRIKNSGVNEIEGIAINDIYLDLLKHPRLQENVKDTLLLFLKPKE